MGYPPRRSYYEPTFPLLLLRHLTTFIPSLIRDGNSGAAGNIKPNALASVGNVEDSDLALRQVDRDENRVAASTVAATSYFYPCATHIQW